MNSKLLACLQFFGLHEQRCLACHGIYQPKHGLLCDSCLQNLQPHDPSKHCPSCGELLIYSSPEPSPSNISNQDALDQDCNPSQGQAPSQQTLPCPECQKNPPPWQKFYFYGIYGGTLRQLLLKGKFSSDLPILRYLGSLIAKDFSNLDALVPIPLHPFRLQKRGFNQSYELALPLAKALGLPLEPSFITRKINTQYQSRLNRNQRLTNLKDAFTSSRNLVECKHILLIDDTCTTGSTLRHASLALLQAGVASVQVAVIAKTISI